MKIEWNKLKENKEWFIFSISITLGWIVIILLIDIFLALPLNLYKPAIPHINKKFINLIAY